jgi:hypothetical protein
MLVKTLIGIAVNHVITLRRLNIMCEKARPPRKKWPSGMKTRPPRKKWPSVMKISKDLIQSEDNGILGAGAGSSPHGNAGAEVETKPHHIAKEDVNKDTGGMKDNKGKPPYELLAWESMDEIAQAYVLGDLTKYSPGNWRKGINWTQLYAAAFRHLRKSYLGEDYDAEARDDYQLDVLHLAQVAWHCMALISYLKYGNHALDDRYFKPMAKERPDLVYNRKDIDENNSNQCSNGTGNTYRCKAKHG